MNINANVGSVGNSATLVHVLRARFGAGRIVLPTSGSRVYTHLKHVQGVPSSIEGQGYSIHKMRAIDSMIATAYERRCTAHQCQRCTARHRYSGGNRKATPRGCRWWRSLSPQIGRGNRPAYRPACIALVIHCPDLRGSFLPCYSNLWWSVRLSTLVMVSSHGQRRYAVAADRCK